MVEPRTDYMPHKEFVKRAHEAVQHGEKYTHSSGEMLIDFDSDFDKFAANVAYAIREKVVYRSDGGVFARGLVRASEDLKKIHDLYMGGSPPPANGSKIRLRAIFSRRKDPVASDRWMRVVRFNAPDWDDEEPDVIFASQAATDAGWAKAMRTVLDCAVFLDKDFTGDQGDQIRKMVAIADRLGYPRNWNLWYYWRDAAAKYARWRTPDDDRTKMTLGTRGGMPFDGNTGYPPGEWRIYPFREMAKTYGHLDHGHCDLHIHRELERHHEAIHGMFDDIDQELGRSGMALSYVQSFNIFNKQSKYSVEVGAFFEHLDSLVKDPDHLYSAFQ